MLLPPCSEAFKRSCIAFPKCLLIQLISLNPTQATNSQHDIPFFQLSPNWISMRLFLHHCIRRQHCEMIACAKFIIELIIKTSNQMGPYLSQPIRDKKMKSGSGAGFSFWVAEMQGWRKTMEDAAIHEASLGDGNALFAVFDGHGGHEVSKYVEQKFTNLLTTLQLYKDKQYAAALDLAFKKMDEILLSQQVTLELNKLRGEDVSNPISKSTGCTANVVLITSTHYYVANAGDSRSVLCREGKAVELSFDHKPESEEEIKRIKGAGGVVYMGRVNGGLNLTRSFGDFQYKSNKSLEYHQQMITCKPDVQQISRQSQQDEFIVIGCDGIWEKYVQNSQGLIDIVKKSFVDKLQGKQILEKLMDQLIAKDSVQGLGCDNMTSILIRFN